MDTISGTYRIYITYLLIQIVRSFIGMIFFPNTSMQSKYKRCCFSFFQLYHKNINFDTKNRRYQVYRHAMTKNVSEYLNKYFLISWGFLYFFLTLVMITQCAQIANRNSISNLCTSIVTKTTFLQYFFFFKNVNLSNATQDQIK